MELSPRLCAAADDREGVGVVASEFVDADGTHCAGLERVHTRAVEQGERRAALGVEQGRHEPAVGRAEAGAVHVSAHGTRVGQDGGIGREHPCRVLAEEPRPRLGGRALTTLAIASRTAATYSAGVARVSTSELVRNSVSVIVDDRVRRREKGPKAGIETESARSVRVDRRARGSRFVAGVDWRIDEHCVPDNSHRGQRTERYRRRQRQSHEQQAAVIPNSATGMSRGQCRNIQS